MKMIKVKLVGLEPLSSVIAFELSEFLSGLGVLALPRERDVVIDLSELSDYYLNVASLVNELKRTLDKLGMAGDYVIEVDEDTITIRALSSERVAEILEQVNKNSVRPEICPHCGFTTPYPEVMREHIKIHYLL
ncbi:MAG: C2H2-type zinc finger protein [Nitrososphaerota archaeon]